MTSSNRTWNGVEGLNAEQVAQLDDYQRNNVMPDADLRVTDAAVKREGGQTMDHVKQLRQVLELVNPADLTMNDRLALLALIGRCFENDGGAGPQHGC